MKKKIIIMSLVISLQFIIGAFSTINANEESTATTGVSITILEGNDDIPGGDQNTDEEKPEKPTMPNTNDKLPATGIGPSELWISGLAIILIVCGLIFIIIEKRGKEDENQENI